MPERRLISGDGRTLLIAVLGTSTLLTLALIGLAIYAASGPFGRWWTEMQRNADAAARRADAMAGPPDISPSREQPRPPAGTHDPAAWITADDYPPASLRAEEQGAVRIGWSVGADGRAIDCRVLSSSGYPRLDRAACRAILARARYRREPEGLPPRNYTRRVIWRLPTL